jgi:hypothetical protein
LAEGLVFRGRLATGWPHPFYSRSIFSVVVLRVAAAHQIYRFAATRTLRAGKRGYKVRTIEWLQRTDIAVHKELGPLGIFRNVHDAVIGNE